jgi:anthranilate phosphoribosyltransferase
VLERLGSRRVMIVHGLEGLDEISLSGPTMVGELRDGAIREYTIAPEDFGFERAESSSVRVNGVDESKAMMLGALENRAGAPRDIVAFNAGASIYVAGLTASLAEGVDKARATLASGAARRKLDDFVAVTRDV